MRESERTIRERACGPEESVAAICRRVLTDRARYAIWHARHEKHMQTVARQQRRDDQILALRAVSLQQIHRTALVRVVRERGITGAARDTLLREFYGVLDPREAAITEHRNYLDAASTAICVAELLSLADDDDGVLLLKRYETAYHEYFGMFCDRSRVSRGNQRGLVDALLPEMRMEAEGLRRRVLAGEALPGPILPKKPLPPGRGAGRRSANVIAAR